MTDQGWRASATATTTGGGRLPSAGWILGVSLWLVPVLFFGGNGAWLGFLVIGALLFRWTWLVAAGVYGIWAIVAAVLPDDRARIVVLAVLQFVSIIHAMFANRRLLVTIWGRIERGDPWWGADRRPAAPRPSGLRQDRRPRAARRRAVEVPREAEDLLSGAGTDRSDYLADPEPAATLPPPRGGRRAGDPPPPTSRPAPASAPAPAGETPSATVDINTATEDDFKTLPGFTGKRARAAVDARSRRGRFASVQEFADDLGLQPHQLVAIRDRLTCSRPRRKSFGRRVDL